MIIVEGPDLVGKTTFCHALVKSLKDSGWSIMYSHFTRLPDAFHRYWGYVDRMSNQVVQDRFHMSEVAYAKMRGDAEMKIDRHMYRMVDARTRLLGSVNVVITADEDLIRSRIGREEMYTPEQIFRVNALFKRAVMNNLDNFVMDVDIHIGCTVKKPYPDENDIARVGTLWTMRQSTLRKMHEQKPPSA